MIPLRHQTWRRSDVASLWFVSLFRVGEKIVFAVKLNRRVRVVKGPPSVLGVVI